MTDMIKLFLSREQTSQIIEALWCYSHQVKADRVPYDNLKSVKINEAIDCQLASINQIISYLKSEEAP